MLPPAKETACYLHTWRLSSTGISGGNGPILLNRQYYRYQVRRFYGVRNSRARHHYKIPTCAGMTCLVLKFPG
jgi:hypothetical protein